MSTQKKRKPSDKPQKPWFEDTTPVKRIVLPAEVRGSNTHNEHCQDSTIQCPDKVQSEWIDIGLVELQGSAMIIDVEKLPKSVRTIVVLSSYYLAKNVRRRRNSVGASEAAQKNDT